MKQENGHLSNNAKKEVKTTNQTLIWNSTLKQHIIHLECYGKNDTCRERVAMRNMYRYNNGTRHIDIDDNVTVRGFVQLSAKRT